MARLGKIIRQRCATDPQPPDVRCGDPAFALANPALCPFTPKLVIRPSFALACALGSVKFSASYFDANGLETDVTDQTVFTSSDQSVAVVGASNGNATGLTAGEASITGAYKDLTGFAELHVLGGDCCASENVAMMVMVDRTRSMKPFFSGLYSTKLVFAKAAATRFINEVNETKDLVGLMRFTAAGYEILSAPTSDKASVAALVPSITQTEQLTTFYTALKAAITSLNAVTADLRVIVLISDGEDKDDSYDATDNPVALLTDFKNAGGIVMAIGVRAHGFGYNLLEALATGGFFLNAYDGIEQATLDFMSGLKGYICAGNCAPTGDEFKPGGSLNYCGFENWNVLDGHVDLLGNGFLDLLPGNGLYVDMAGSRSPFRGRLESKEKHEIQEGKTYRIKLRLAGNQRADATPNTVRVRAFARNNVTIAAPANPPNVGALTGSGAEEMETYEYAYSYVNAYGETPISPVATGDNGGFSNIERTITGDSYAAATLVRFYKRKSSVGQCATTNWYLIGESDPEAPSVLDTFTAAQLAAAAAAGTLDVCAQPVEVNTTAQQFTIFEQDVTIDDVAQQFTEYNLSFIAPYDSEVFLSIQQTETPVGYDATGLLLDLVQFIDVAGATTFNMSGDPGVAGTYTEVEPLPGTEGTWRKDDDYYITFVPGLYTLYGPGNTELYECFENDFPGGPWSDTGGGGTPPTGEQGPNQQNTILFSDDFENENLTYVPPACGIGTTYVGYGQSLYMGEQTDLIPDIDNTNETDGFVATGSWDGMGDNVPYQAFDYSADPNNTSSDWIDDITREGSVWLQIQLPAPKQISSYRLASIWDIGQPPPNTQSPPKVWILQGSSNGTTWETIDERSEPLGGWTVGVARTFSVNPGKAYSYYRITVSENAVEGAILTAISMFQLFGGEPSYCVLDYGYLSGYNCYGEGCLSEPPGVQTRDPKPLTDNEATVPPNICSKTADVVRSCPSGSLYVPSEALSVQSIVVSECPTEGIFKLDGLRWEIRVGHQFPAFGSSTDPPVQAVVLQENGVGIFDVALRFRGVVERRPFTGSPFFGDAPYAGTDNGFVRVPSIPQQTTPASLLGNEYYLFVSNPTNIYALNGIAGDSSGVYLIDYQVTIPIAASSTVALLSLTRDNLSNRNTTNLIVPGITNGTPGTDCAAEIPAANCPFDGQFIQMDVITVTPQ